MYTGIIYCYISPSGKGYVGQTRNEVARKSSFKTKKNYSGNKFDIARKKYGINNFTYKILIKIFNIDLNILQIELNFWEKYYIVALNTIDCGYNVLNGGSNSYPISINTSYSKRIIQYDLDGNFVKVWESIKSAAKHLNINNSCISHSILDEQVTIHGFFKYYTKNYPLKIIRKLNNKQIAAIEKLNSTRKIGQFSKNNQFIKEYDNIKDASSITNKGNIIKCCKGKRKTAGGFIWKYIKNDNRRNI